MVVVQRSSDQRTIPTAADAIMIDLYLMKTLCRKSKWNKIKISRNSYRSMSVIKKTNTNNAKYEYVPQGYISR